MIPHKMFIERRHKVAAAPQRTLEEVGLIPRSAKSAEGENWVTGQEDIAQSERDLLEVRDAETAHSRGLHRDRAISAHLPR